MQLYAPWKSRGRPYPDTSTYAGACVCGGGGEGAHRFECRAHPTRVLWWPRRARQVRVELHPKAILRRRWQGTRARGRPTGRTVSRRNARANLPPRVNVTTEGPPTT